LLESSFLFITGNAFTTDIDPFLRETGAVYVSKPCTSEEIENAVEQVLLRRRAQEINGGLGRIQPDGVSSAS
jgi:hypothetical protein